MGQLVNADTGIITAHYEYQPFGELIHSYGHYAGENGYRFSTKYFDEETGLYYYGYRYYAPELGRWINRDPLGRFSGGNNFYSYGPNTPINGYDILGQRWFYSEKELRRLLFKPLENGLKAAESLIENAFDSGVSTVKKIILDELSKYDDKASTRTSFSFQRHRVWKVANGYISIRFGGRIDVSSDGCCVKVAWGPGGSITGKVPILGLPPAITLRPSGSASIKSSYKYCIGDGKGQLTSADLGVTLALGLRGELPGVENVIVVFVEGGGYVNGKWDLVNGTKNKYSAGLYARGVFDVNIGGLWNERYEYKWTSSGDADIM